MTLGDDLLAQPGEDELCSFGQFVEDSEFREQLLAGIERIVHQRRTKGPKVTTGYTTAWLTGVLQRNGITDYSRYQIQRHIANTCACGRRLALAPDESR